MSIERELIREAYFKLLNYVPENDELVQEMAEYLDKTETNVEDAFETYEKALIKFSNKD